MISSAFLKKHNGIENLKNLPNYLALIIDYISTTVLMTQGLGVYLCNKLQKSVGFDQNIACLIKLNSNIFY